MIEFAIATRRLPVLAWTVVGPAPSSSANTGIPVLALAPVLLAAAAFVVYCLVDLRRSQVRYLPRWAWAVLCVVSVPLGGIVYLLVGRSLGSDR